VTTERAFQQLDPLGAHIGRPMTVVAGATIPIYAVVGTGVNAADITSLPLAVAALVAITAAGILLLLATSPLRAPFTVVSHGLVLGLAITAYVLSAMSMWDSNRLIRDDWGPIAIGFVLLAISQYRPPSEIAKAGLFTALFAGVVALLQVHSLQTIAPPIVFSLITMMPILALSLASAFFGQELIGGLERWRSQIAPSVTSIAEDNGDWIARSVQQDRVTILNQDVVPFFSHVLGTGAVGDVERARAREIANAVRAVMVAEVDRSWLDMIVAQLPGAPTAMLSDPDRLAQAMSTEQRTGLRALLVAAYASARVAPDSLSLTIRAEQGRARVVIAADLVATEGSPRSEFGPYLAVMRITFPDLKVEMSSAALTVRFSYGR
jgi:hypothetical protein